MYLDKLTINFNADGTVRGCRGEYKELDASGRAVPVGTKRLSGAEIEAALPETATIIAGLDAAIAERDAAVAAKTAAESARDAAVADKAELESQFAAEKATLEAQITEGSAR